MEPRNATPLVGTPVNRLFIAINHYVSTSDHIGVGMAADTGDGRMTLIIPVNRYMVQDREDFRRLAARLREIEDQAKEKDQTKEDASIPPFEFELFKRDVPFDHYTLTLRVSDMDALARKLRERPSAFGWGSCKRLIDQYNL